MSIGLFDQDLYTYHLVPLNLELMKLSAYYKKKLEIVHMSPTFSPEYYSKFIYRKDYSDGNFPVKLYTSSNIEYGGRAFNPTKYVPLPIDIEMQHPDKYIYDFFSKKIRIKGEQRIWKTLLNAEHIRLSLDGTNIWDSFDKQLNISTNTRILFFHDYNLNAIQNSDIIIKELEKQISSYFGYGRIGTKFPIQVENSADLFKWSTFKTATNFFQIQYNGMIEDEVLFNLVQQQDHSKKTSFLSYISYNFTDGYTEKETIDNLETIFKQIIFLKNNGFLINLIYPQNYFSTNMWEGCIKLINTFLRSSVENNHDDTLFDFAKALKELTYVKKNILTRQDARNIFSFVGKNNFSLFELFYNCKTVQLKGGQFQNV